MQNIALGILTRRGYYVWFDKQKKYFCATKNDWRFLAKSPLSLLGLVTIYETKQPKIYEEYWWNDTKKIMPIPLLPSKKKKYRQIIE